MPSAEMKICLPFKAGFRYNREYLGVAQDMAAGHYLKKCNSSLGQTKENFIENLLDGN